MEAYKEATQMGRGLIQGSSGEDDKNTKQRYPLSSGGRGWA